MALTLGKPLPATISPPDQRSPGPPRGLLGGSWVCSRRSLGSATKAPKPPCTYGAPAAHRAVPGKPLVAEGLSFTVGAVGAALIGPRPEPAGGAAAAWTQLGAYVTGLCKALTSAGRAAPAGRAALKAAVPRGPLLSGSARPPRHLPPLGRCLVSAYCMPGSDRSSRGGGSRDGARGGEEATGSAVQRPWGRTEPGSEGGGRAVSWETWA